MSSGPSKKKNQLGPDSDKSNNCLSPDKNHAPKLKPVPTWQLYLQSLAIFKAETGHLNVPSDYIDPRDNTKLGAWVVLMRKEYQTKQKNRSYRSQVLSAGRALILTAMGMEWADHVNEPKDPPSPPTQPWWVDYLHLRKNPASFVQWAEGTIHHLETTNEFVVDEDPHDVAFGEYERSFRISLLKLSLENRLRERFMQS